MSRKCELTGVRPLSGNLVSHSNRKSRTKWMPNLKSKKFVISEAGGPVTILLSTRAIRTIDKQGGIVKALLKAKTEKLSPKLLKIRKLIEKKLYGSNIQASTDKKSN